MTKSRNRSISTSSHPKLLPSFLYLIVNYSNKIIKYNVGCKGVGRKRIILNSCRNKNYKINLEKNQTITPPSLYLRIS